MNLGIIGSGMIVQDFLTIADLIDDMKLEAILGRKESIEKMILGFPKNMNGTIGPRALTTLDFKKKLEDTFNIEVELQDERLSTKEATNYMIKADVSRKKRKKKIDSLAANIILQTYLDKRKDWKKCKKTKQ